MGGPKEVQTPATAEDRVVGPQIMRQRYLRWAGGSFRSLLPLISPSPKTATQTGSAMPLPVWYRVGIGLL